MTSSSSTDAGIGQMSFEWGQPINAGDALINQKCDAGKSLVLLELCQKLGAGLAKAPASGVPQGES